VISDGTMLRRACGCGGAGWKGGSVDCFCVCVVDGECALRMK
jgi:hypothetical protein